MSDEVQISAYISRATKRKLDAYSRQTGVKKSRIIEDALDFHFRALDEIPGEYLLPARMVLSHESYRCVIDRLREPDEPSRALRELMAADLADVDITVDED